MIPQIAEIMKTSGIGQSGSTTKPVTTSSTTIQIDFSSPKSEQIPKDEKVAQIKAELADKIENNDAGFQNTEIESIDNLKEIGKDAYFDDTEIESFIDKAKKRLAKLEAKFKAKLAPQGMGTL